MSKTDKAKEAKKALELLGEMYKPSPKPKKEQPTK
jgi:hypothetical protein